MPPTRFGRAAAERKISQSVAYLCYAFVEVGELIQMPPDLKAVCRVGAPVGEQETAAGRYAETAIRQT